MKSILNLKIVVLSLMLFTNSVFCQTDSSVCYYDTKADFFANKKTTDPIAKFIQHCYWSKSINAGQFVWTVADYCGKGSTKWCTELTTVAYDDKNKEIARGRTKWINQWGPKECLALFLGGGPKAYAFTYAIHASYNNEGYATDVICNQYYDIQFVDANAKEPTQDIEEFLKAKPSLLTKYKAEKKDSDKKAWKRGKLEIGMKYVKLFNAEK